jgi:hypothetical protein
MNPKRFQNEFSWDGFPASSPDRDVNTPSGVLAKPPNLATLKLP